MADLRISELPALLTADAEATDDLAVADYSSSETRRLTLKGVVQKGVTVIDDGVMPGVKLVPDSVTAREIAPDAVTASELADNAVDTAAIADLAVTNSKIAAGVDGAKLITDSVTAVQIAPDAITSSELADDAVDTAALKDAAVTNAKLAAGIDGAKLTDGTVTNVKLAAGIDGAKLLPDSVTAREIADHAITAGELANGAVDTAAVQDLAITDAKIAAGLDGAKLTADTVTAAKIPTASLDRGLDKTSGAIGHTNVVTAGNRNGITFDAYGHVTSTAALVPSDLPPATTTAIGGVSVPATSGLTVSGIGSLDHSNTVTPGTRNGISYDAHGHIITAVALVPSDLPTATSTAPGAASFPGPDVTVDGTGAVHHSTSGVAAGTYAKVTINSTGHVTVGAPLTAADVPDLDAAKITGGVLDAARIGNGTISAAKLADYALAYIQEAVPPAGVGTHPIGMTWLQESTGQVSVWNGNSWMKTGASTLFNKNLRYCGTYNPATGLVTGVTQFGTADGFKIGDTIPAADDKHAGCYFVASSSGTSSSIASGAVFDAGDWLLCQGTTGGWVRIDTLSGGGGGGSVAVNLDDLLDVTLTAPATGDILQLNAAGQWVNVNYYDAGTY